MNAISLAQPAYTTAVKLRGYTAHRTVLGMTTIQDSARALRRLAPAWSKTDHLGLAQAHAQQFEQFEQQYNQTLDEAAQATFGRPFQFHDYRVSAIGREEFSEAHKCALRQLRRQAQDHKTLARAHWAAAGHRKDYFQ